MAAAAPLVAVNGVKIATNTLAYLDSKQVKETRGLISDLCRQFYNLGWVGGTGGSITIKVHDDCIPKPQQLIVMSPSGVQKERMLPEDMYILSPEGCIISSPTPKSNPHKPPKCSDCAPLFMKAYHMRNAGAVIHSHGMESCIVTMMNPGSKEFKITHMEMIKGIQGHGYYDELVVPIIENTAHERELTDSLAAAIEAYPKSTAVLVRNHGIYVWGDSWISTKTQAECYHYLFDAAIKLYQMGLDWSTPTHGPIKAPKAILRSGGSVAVSARMGTDGEQEPFRRCIVLDIEGTTTPISFVSEVLFPYARENVGRHLSATYESTETQGDIKLLRAQVQDDLEKGIAGAVPIPPDNEGKEEVVAALVANVEAMIKADRKITSLKQLQGHIWRTGYKNKELQGVVFADVPSALERWHNSGIKVYIYSSGSRLAQRLIFGNTNFGDLRKYLSGFFDTTIGNKRESRSYVEINESVGVDNPSEILFVTDVYEEATAAKAAGLEVIISVRPGNGPLPENHGFKTHYNTLPSVARSLIGEGLLFTGLFPSFLSVRINFVVGLGEEQIPSMVITSKHQDRENPSPLNSPSSHGSNSLTTTNGGTHLPITRSDPNNPYPTTTFVTADTFSFKQVVQMLTGSSETLSRQHPHQQQSPNPQDHLLPPLTTNSKSFPIPPIKNPPKKQGFKLYERRNILRNGLMISPLTVAANLGGGNFSPRKLVPEILSPSLLDFPSLMLSPVTPLTPVDPFDNKGSPSTAESNSMVEEEQKAIAEKGFYLHPSPRSVPELPQLLPLFPVTSPRVSEVSQF
ncbi:hypothetical protein Dimus_012659 [Dionaea muscipula]